MQLIKDIGLNKKIIEKSIKKHGFFAEHNFHHYKNIETKYKNNIFFSFPGDMGVLASVTKSDVWYMFAEVLAPIDKRMDVFLRFLDHVAKKENFKKLVIEVSKDFKDQLENRLKKTEYKICKTNFVLYWPVFDMNIWDGKLKGKDWKKLRNIKNRMYKNHSVVVKDAKNVSKEKLIKLVSHWCKERMGDDKVELEYYKSMINNDFTGYDLAKTVLVDGQPCSLYAGWKIPNSNKYYSAIGVANYEHKGIIDVSNLCELNELKKIGFKTVDFGGSDKCLLISKKKFKPNFIYKTYTFSIKFPDKKK